MNIKEYLSRALWLDHRINVKAEQLETLRALATKVTTNVTKEKVSGGRKKKSQVESTVAQIVDLEKEINADIKRLVGIKADIMAAINLVEEPISQLVLEMRYINGMSWNQVARRLQFDRSWISRLHGSALKEIEDKLKHASKSNKKHRKQQEAQPGLCYNIK